MVSWPGLAPNGYSGKLVVAALDLSANKGLAAFRQHYDRPGKPSANDQFGEKYAAGDVRGDLVNDLRKDLEDGTVALGLEGPCWGAAKGPLGPLVGRPFEGDKSYSWVGGSGGPAAVKGMALLHGLLNELGTTVQNVTYGVAGPTACIGQAHTLWLWEAYVAGNYKPSLNSVPQHLRGSQDIADAYAAVAWGFASMPQSTPPQTAPPVFVPITGQVLVGAGLLNPTKPDDTWWKEPCLVIAPKTPTAPAQQFWPQTSLLPNAGVGQPPSRAGDNERARPGDGQDRQGVD